MVVDGDPAGESYRTQLLHRGFTESDLTGHLEALPAPNHLESQLLVDGHEVLLREILVEFRGTSAQTCSTEELAACLKDQKTNYMSKLALQVASDSGLAARMPAPFVRLIVGLRDGTL
jgi:molybdopterin-biosynthesis enzyme MoeA-like protein